MKTKLLASTLILCVVAMCLVGCTSSSGGGGTNINNGIITNNSQSDNSSTTENNKEYEKIFSERYIIATPSFFVTPNKASFVKIEKTDDGSEYIYRQDFGYRNDIVEQMSEMIYYSTSEMSDTEKQTFEANMKAAFSKFDNADCCSVTYQQLNNYFLIKAEYKDVHTSSALAELYSLETTESTSPISMEKTESNLLAKGFIKQ